MRQRPITQTMYHSSIQDWSTLEKLPRIYTSSTPEGASIRAAELMFMRGVHEWTYNLFQVFPLTDSFAEPQFYDGHRWQRVKMWAKEEDYVPYKPHGQDLHAMNYCVRPKKLALLEQTQWRVINTWSRWEEVIHLKQLRYEQI